MKEGNLPVGARVAQLAVEPRQLIARHVVAVEGEESDARRPEPVLLERVEALPVHVERFVEHLVGVVVVAERRVEGNVRVADRLVRQLELADEVLRPFRPIHVVARHDDELVGEHGMRRPELRSDVVLRAIARSRVAEHGEPDRILADWRSSLVFRLDRGPAGLRSCKYGRRPRRLARFGARLSADGTHRGRQNRNKLGPFPPARHEPPRLTSESGIRRASDRRLRCRSRRAGSGTVRQCGIPALLATPEAPATGFRETSPGGASSDTPYLPRP